MADSIKGYRTLIIGVFGMLCLVVGLWLIVKEHRHEAYFSFATGIGCIVGALAAKSVGTSAVGGEGLKKGFQNLTGTTTPGEPPPPPTP